MSTKVVNLKHERYDVFIGRPSKWGNPWSHIPYAKAELVSSRDEAIARYREWLSSQPNLLADLEKELRDRVLGCYCRPKRGFHGKLMCHGQILAALCDGIKPEEVP